MLILEKGHRRFQHEVLSFFYSTLVFADGLKIH